MNDLYDYGRQAILDGSIDYGSDSIRVALVSSSYGPNLSSDEFLSDVPSGAIVATSDPLTGKTEAAGVARADNATLNSVSGAHIAYLVIYKDTGAPTTSRLLAFIDTATGLPYTPNGGSITISWDTGPDGIFKI